MFTLLGLHVEFHRQEKYRCKLSSASQPSYSKQAYDDFCNDWIVKVLVVMMMMMRPMTELQWHILSNYFKHYVLRHLRGYRNKRRKWTLKDKNGKGGINTLPYDHTRQMKKVKRKKKVRSFLRPNERLIPERWMEIESEDGGGGGRGGEGRKRWMKMCWRREKITMKERKG